MSNWWNPEQIYLDLMRDREAVVAALERRISKMPFIIRQRVGLPPATYTLLLSNVQP